MLSAATRSAGRLPSPLSRTSATGARSAWASASTAPLCTMAPTTALTLFTRPSRGAPFALARGCTLKWYAPGEACSLLARAGTLVVVGDSLARHLVQALFSALSGDYALGATVEPALEAPECADGCAS
jgi:hypothetical protein